MPSRIDDLLERITQLEREVEIELDRARAEWRYRIEAGRVRFERDVRLAHDRLKQSIPAFIRESSPLNLLTAPIIYSLIAPIALLDLWITLYQALCFPLYGIARVRRSTYIVIDRHHLAYLNAIEKVNCVYMRVCERRVRLRPRSGRTHRAVPGVRSGTRSASGRHTHITASSSTMATPRDTTGSCLCSASNSRATSPSSTTDRTAACVQAAPCTGLSCMFTACRRRRV